jgi:putative membrane protein
MTQKKAGFMQFMSEIRSKLGLEKGKADESDVQVIDEGTILAHQRTDLAIERSYLAADRTLMAWIRTALSMISFGFTIGKLGQVMESVEVAGAFQTKTVSIESIAYFLTILGTLSLLVAAFQHFIRVRRLRTMGFRTEFSLSFIVALVLVLVGGFALSSLILAL